MLDYTKIPIDRVREMWKKYPQGYPTVIVTPSLPPNKDAYGYIYETFIDDPESSLFGKYYIGQFVQHQIRGFEDGRSYFGSGAIISKYIKARGKKFLKKKILEYANSQEELNTAEIKWITTIDKNSRSLNLKTGGRAGRLTELSASKISETLKNRWKNDSEFALRMRASYKLRTFPSQKGKPKLGLTDAGRKSLAEHAAKTHTGRKRSQETKDKISLALTGRTGGTNSRKGGTYTELCCLGCGKSFGGPRWSMRNRKYCSRGCATIYTNNGWAEYHRRKNGTTT